MITGILRAGTGRSVSRRSALLTKRSNFLPFCKLPQVPPPKGKAEPEMVILGFL